MQKISESFNEMVRTDSLFAAEGLTIAGARQALEGLKSVISDLEAVYSENSWLRKLFLIRYPLAQYAVPVPFLQAFVESENLRRIYMSDSTEENARRLLAGWTAASRAYTTSIKKYTRLHRILHGLEKNDKPFIFNDMVGNQTMLADINRMLALLAQNAGLLERTVQEREKMLARDTDIRNTGVEFRPFSAEYKKGTATPLYERLHAFELQNSTFMQGEVLETYGPLRYTLAHFDGRPTEHLFMVYLMNDAISRLPAVRVSLVDRFYFLPIAGPRARFGGIGRAPFELLIKRGLRYFYQPASFLYTARDQQYWADILTIVDRARRPHLNQQFVESQRSSLLDLLLAATVSDIRTYIDHSRERIAQGGLEGYSFFFGLLMRSHPSIFFLSFNQSVWRLPERPDFLGSKRTNDAETPYVTEDTVLADTTPEELDLIMQGGRLRKEAREKEGF